MMIKNIQKQIFKDPTCLRDKKFCNKNNLFLVEGKKHINEIPKNWTIKQIFISKEYKNSSIDFGYKNIRILSERLFNKLSATKSPQGIIAVVEKKQHNIKEIVKTSGTFMILENIQDPGNLGTIIRSADAFGIKAIFSSKGSASIYSDKVIRATMGSMFHLPVIDNIDIKNLLNLMKENEISVFASSLKGKRYLNDIKIQNNSAFIIGNEGNGLKDETEKLADTLVKIRMPGNAESLNAAIVASLIMYEISKNMHH